MSAAQRVARSLRSALPSTSRGAVVASGSAVPRRCIASSSKARLPEVHARQAAGQESASVPPPSSSVKREVEQDQEPPAATSESIPDILQPVKAHPPTHGVHVCTLHLRAYGTEKFGLEFFTDFARRAAYELGIPCGGVARLPTRTALWTVPRSPFVHKKSQENFERRTHKRVIKLWDASDEVVDRWLHFLRIHSLAGVGMKAQVFRYQPLGIGAKVLEGARELRRARSLDAPAGDQAAGSSLDVKTPPQTSESAVKALADQIVAAENKKEELEQAGQSDEAASAAETPDTAGSTVQAPKPASADENAANKEEDVSAQPQNPSMAKAKTAAATATPAKSAAAPASAVDARTPSSSSESSLPSKDEGAAKKD